jgi:hypothetical protein
LTVIGTGATSVNQARATLGHANGKWYFEIRRAANGISSNQVRMGVTALDTSSVSGGLGGGAFGLDCAFDCDTGRTYHNNNYGYAINGAVTATVGDVVGCAVDIDNHKIWFSVNGVWNGNPAAGTGNAIDPAFTPWTGTLYAATSMSSTTSAPQTQLAATFDGGGLAYTAPSGFLAWASGADTPVPDAPGWRLKPDGTLAGSAATLTRNQVALSSIVADLLGREGLVSSDYNVSALTDMVDGYRIAIEGGADAFIMPLAQAYFFDPGEWGAKMQFVKRGGTGVVSLDPTDLVERSGPAIEQTRSQEAELLRKVNVVSLDPAAGYTQTKQTAERRAATVSAKGEATVEVPLVMSANAAAQVAQKRLKIAWSETEKFKFSLSVSKTRITPTDVVTLTDKSGVSHRLRIMDMQVDSGRYEIEASKDRQASYTSAVTGTIITGPVVNTPGLIGPTTLQIMNLPVWTTDADDSVGLYVAGYGVLSGWHGADIQVSTDSGLTYNSIGQIITPATIGATSTALLADTVDAPSLQSLTVTLRDAPATVDYATLLRYANRAALLSDSGKWEILQFQTVTSLGGSSYQLDGLVRGRYNTAPTAAAAGAALVILDASVLFVPIDRSQIGVTYSVKAVSTGTSIDSYTAISYAFSTSVSQAEWPVGSVAGSRDGSNNVAVTFVGAARLGTSLQPHNSRYFTGYRVSYTSGGTTKTFDVTTQTHSYTAAQQTTDFGSLPGSLVVTVAALNSITGTGPASTGITV